MTCRSSFVLFLLFVGSYAQNETKIDTKHGDPRCEPGCIWENNMLYSDTLKNFPKNCTTVCTESALYIGYETDLTEKQLTETFQNMKRLVGDIIINRSKYKSGRFLAALETIDCDNRGTFQWTLNDKMTEIGLPNLRNISCDIRIGSNKNLTRLNLPNMKPVQSPTANYSSIQIDISDGAPDFCVTVQEMSNIISYDFADFRLMSNGISGKYCELLNTSILDPKICDIQNSTFSNMDSGCVKILGDLVIQREDEGHLQKLETVETIFGSLTIQDTNLTNLSFLKKLQHIVSLTEGIYALRVDENPFLVNISLPSIKRLESRPYVPASFNNNSNELLKNLNHCNDFQHSLLGQRRLMLTIDDKSCWELEIDVRKTEERNNKDKSSRNSFTISVLSIFILFSFMLNY